MMLGRNADGLMIVKRSFFSGRINHLHINMAHFFWLFFFVFVDGSKKLPVETKTHANGAHFSADCSGYDFQRLSSNGKTSSC